MVSNKFSNFFLMIVFFQISFITSMENTLQDKKQEEEIEHKKNQKKT